MHMCNNVEYSDSAWCGNVHCMYQLRTWKMTMMVKWWSSRWWSSSSAMLSTGMFLVGLKQILKRIECSTTNILERRVFQVFLHTRINRAHCMFTNIPHKWRLGASHKWHASRTPFYWPVCSYGEWFWSYMYNDFKRPPSEAMHQRSQRLCALNGMTSHVKLGSKELWSCYERRTSFMCNKLR